MFWHVLPWVIHARGQLLGGSLQIQMLFLHGSINAVRITKLSTQRGDEVLLLLDDCVQAVDHGRVGSGVERAELLDCVEAGVPFMIGVS
ncbi:hypothetical protein D3C75_1121430 [compost metagenome]